jgi:ABC-2 type transport system permease protein
MFGTSAAISGERRQQTLSALLASPASRTALFLGRALPSIVTGVVVAVTSATICALILDVSIDGSQIPALLVVALVASFSCTSLGLWLGAFGLRGRNMTVFADAIAGLMLIVTGVNAAREPAAVGAGDRQVRAADSCNRGGARHRGG